MCYARMANIITPIFIRLTMINYVDDLCMSCLEHHRDKVDTMIGILFQSGMPGEFVNMVKDLFACD